MELSWLNKLRIGAVVTLGVVVIGLAAWPLAISVDPLLPVRAGNLGFGGTVVLLVLAFAVGFAGYFIAWPHGREIGILGVPFGLTVWAGRSGPMRTLTQSLPGADERMALLQSLRFEPFYWLLIVAAGFAGVLVAQRLRPVSGPGPSLAQVKQGIKGVYLNIGIALVISTLLVAFFTGVFAQDLYAPAKDAGGGSSVLGAAQPEKGQIIFAMLGAFGVAAFVVKKFLNLSYVWSVAASLFVLPFAYAIYGDTATITRFAQTEPATFYPHAVFAILPLQCVAIGALGAVTGYWLAVRYDYWRQHESAV